MRPARLPSLLAFALITLAASATAQDGFTGLPATGQLDAGRVLAARYGEPVKLAQQKQLQQQQGIEGGLTGVFVDSTGSAGQEDVPLTFGQVFAPGDLRQPERLTGKLGGKPVPLQVDVKARHPDGSVRHAVISAVVPALAPKQSLMLVLAADGKAAPAKPAASGPAAPRPAAAGPAALLGQGFRAGVSAGIDGQAWTASAERLLAGKGVETWLAGPLVTEWQVTAPLVNAQGAAHPHLAARFAVRWYPQTKRARVDVTVENDWAYEPGPRNFSYDARVEIGGREAWARPGLKHLHHARWRKVFWWGEAPALELRHDTPYLIATRAVPNYDQSIVPAEAALDKLHTRWKGDAVEPMGAGLATPYMPTTGGRGDIGLLPDWAVLYLLSMDRRARQATLGGGDLAGSWPIHYRDRRSGRPVSLLDYPYMTRLGHKGDTRNPATGKYEAFPDCAADKACDTPYSPDVSHQPNLAYLPYLLTGDHYYLEELQFWASYDAFSSNPNYRDNAKGLLKSDQVRGQAWALRTIGDAAYITPDADRLKSYFMGVVKHNLDWYNTTYTRDPKANRLGVIVNGYAFSYRGNTGIAPWQDDFFTSAVGHLADLGFEDARPLLAWKSRFPIARMTGQGTCWIEGAMYDVQVRDTRDGPIYDDIGQVYRASQKPDIQKLPCAGQDMAVALKLRSGEMSGFSSSAMGFPSNMQPALAYAADSAGKPGLAAWKRFMARSVQPDYSGAPQFAIVPRKAAD